MQESKTNISNKIIMWGKNNKDFFPWRKPNSFYNSAVAEIMLIRTPPEQVLPVYKEFLYKYPQYKDLAYSNLAEVEYIIKPLGLVWRAKRLKDMAIYLNNNKTKIFDLKNNNLTDIPGIGTYIEAAISIFYFKKRAILVDSNTVRFFKRYYNITFSGEARRKKTLFKEMNKLTPDTDERSILFNESFLDFMRKICKPRNPLCTGCFLRYNCKYSNHIIK